LNKDIDAGVFLEATAPYDYESFEEGYPGDKYKLFDKEEYLYVAPRCFLTFAGQCF
jgi:hypothetical protein